jgi:hypothetical protein
MEVLAIAMMMIALVTVGHCTAPAVTRVEWERCAVVCVPNDGIHSLDNRGNCTCGNGVSKGIHGQD